MKSDYEVNDLRIGADWIGFTLDSLDLTNSLGLFGFDLSDFKLMERGSQGYKRMLRHSSQALTVLYDGTQEMGIHFDVKGSAVPHFLKVFQASLYQETPFGPGCSVDGDFLPDDVLVFLFRKILAEGHLTRLDISIDDLGCRFFSVNDVVRILDSCNYVSKFRKWKHIIEKDSAGCILGNTVYMGSRQSDVMLRIYDKQLEQAKKDGAPVFPWVRWEFELKDMRASVFADMVVDHKVDFGQLGMMLLSSYLRFIVPNDSNKSRCSTLPLWREFTASVGKLKLTLPKSEQSVERKLQWINRQCMPTIAGLTYAALGDLSFLTTHMADHFNRLSFDNQKMFEAYRDAQLEDLSEKKESL